MNYRDAHVREFVSVERQLCNERSYKLTWGENSCITQLGSEVGHFRDIKEINGRKGKLKNIAIRMYEVVCKDVDNWIHVSS